MSKKNFRKTAAIGLAFIGVAGVGIASAATLYLEGGDSTLAQAGTTALTYGQCQGIDPVSVRYGLVDDEGNNVAGVLTSDTGVLAQFGYASQEDALVLDGINEACEGRTIKVALGGTAGELIGEHVGTVPDGGVLTLGEDDIDWTGAVLTATLAVVSVTILD